MKIFLATNNGGKIERFRNLLKQVDRNIKVLIPTDLNIEIIDVAENGKTLAENAMLKAKAYFGKVDLPILANDTGFYIKGDGLVDAPKRKALGETDENVLSKEEISKRLLKFWKEVATRHGGKVDAAWVEAFAVLYPNGETEEAESRREILLTNQEFGIPHLQMPVRALYYSKTTNKPAIQHTEKEEMLEMKPVIDALIKVLRC
jgi:inosine/xanthosine triphosphate pyrophosphatase family protein